MRHLANEVLLGEQLILSDDVVNYLGPNLVLRQCQIKLNVTPKAVVFSGVTFDCCNIKAERKLSGFQGWCRAVVRGCTFSGWFCGNNFGHLEDQPGGWIENCDFRRSILDGCQFIDCDIRTIKLPSWPCFTIIDPIGRELELTTMDCPEDLGFWFGGLPCAPEGTVAVTGYATSLAKECGVTERQLYGILASMKDIVL